MQNKKVVKRKCVSKITVLPKVAYYIAKDGILHAER